MPYECKLVDIEKIRENGGSILPGYMWYAVWYVDSGYKPTFLSDEYYNNWYGKRPPIVIVLPNGSYCLLDGKKDENIGDSEYVITGIEPVITVSSIISDGIRSKEGYSGILIDGILSDDIVGRNYEWKWGKSYGEY